jgi:Mce-associated membrane protein
MSTPTQPGPPRRRATGIRRPRVAGRVPGRPAGPVEADVPGALFITGDPADASDVARPAVADAAVDTTPDPAAVGSAGADPGGLDPASGVHAGVDAPTGDGGLAERADSADGAGATDDLTGSAEGVRATDRVPEDSTQDERPVADRPRPAPTGKRQQRHRSSAAKPRPRRPRKPIPLSVLATALALVLGLAVFFGIADAQLRGTPAVQNTALVDIGTTALVSQQVDDALKTIYSFDYTRLDQNETAARAVITPGFAAQFNQLFDQVRRLAPQQQAVVTATVNLSAVKSINGDTAVLLVFLDQQATRAQAGTQPQQLAAAGRLTVTAQLVDGTWKVADVQPR